MKGTLKGAVSAINSSAYELHHLLAPSRTYMLNPCESKFFASANLDPSLVPGTYCNILIKSTVFGRYKIWHLAQSGPILIWHSEDTLS